MKPRIKQLAKSGDSTAYWVEYGGHGQRVNVSRGECIVKNWSPLQVLAKKVSDLMARHGQTETVRRLTAPSH
jgi:hypothetical protein